MRGKQDSGLVKGREWSAPGGEDVGCGGPGRGRAHVRRAEAGSGQVVGKSSGVLWG